MLMGRRLGEVKRDSALPPLLMEAREREEQKRRGNGGGMDLRTE